MLFPLPSPPLSPSRSLAQQGPFIRPQGPLQMAPPPGLVWQTRAGARNAAPMRLARSLAGRPRDSCIVGDACGSSGGWKPACLPPAAPRGRSRGGESDGGEVGAEDVRGTRGESKGGKRKGGEERGESGRRPWPDGEMEVGKPGAKVRQHQRHPIASRHPERARGRWARLGARPPSGSRWRGSGGIAAQGCFAAGGKGKKRASTALLCCLVIVIVSVSSLKTRRAENASGCCSSGWLQPWPTPSALDGPSPFTPAASSRPGSSLASRPSGGPPCPRSACRFRLVPPVSSDCHAIQSCRSPTTRYVGLADCPSRSVLSHAQRSAYSASRMPCIMLAMYSPSTGRNFQPWNEPPVAT